MTGQDPETLQFFAYAAIVMGILQFGYGQFQKRSPDRTAQGVATIMTWAAFGWFAAAAICYFGSMHDWIMIPALVAFFALSGVGSLLYIRSLNAGGNGDIVS